MESKLTGLGIPYLYIGEYLEQSPLGKAEWIVVLGELTGRREAAEKAYLEIEERYKAVHDKVVGNTGIRPKVMLNTPYADNWYMPSDSSYFVRLIEDAGGEYVYPGNGGNKSVTIDMEEAYLLTRSADVWINVGQYTSIKHLLGDYPMFSDCGCVKDGNVWNCNLRTNRGGGNDFWESGAVRPDLVLQDLVQVFGTDTTNTPLTYYRRLE
ncbi:MAG: ABC transporter substrate-binding protein [Bacteroidales bacterium]|nr:ABC transporter substrate-binding protein [Bacteroidales bacterium]